MSKANHPIEQEELMAYLDGELSADQAAVAATHLEQCADCQAIADALQGVSHRLAAWEVKSSSPDGMRAVSAAVHERLRKPAGPVDLFCNSLRRVLGVRSWIPWASAFAAVCLIVVVGTRLIGSNANNVFSSVGSAVGDDDQGVTVTRSLPQVRGQLGARMQTKIESTQELPSITGPMIVRTAGLKLITKEFDGLRTALENILKRHRGYVGEMNVSAPAVDGRVLNTTLRIPADQLDAVIAEVKKLGRVESETQGGQEVTAQYVDLQARLANARNTESRLTDVLRQRTGKLADVLAVEAEIARVRGEIESMEAERKNMANRVALATLTLTATEDYNARLQIVPLSAYTQFRNAAVEGYQTVTDTVVSLVVFLFSYGPSLLFWGGLLFFPARSVWKMFRRNLAQ